jgi:hypothetical protein
VTGDTITVSAGSYTASTVTNVTKAVTITASGTVTVTCGSDTDNMIHFTETTAGVEKLTGFIFASGSCSETNFGSHFILLTTATNGRPVLIGSNTFNGQYSAIRAETNRGVIYQNTFDARPYAGSIITTEALQAKCEASCATSWSSNSTLGVLDTDGEHNLYFETNTIYQHTTETIDMDGSSRTVIRHNTFDNSGMTSHGTDTGNYGNRQWQISDNTFIFTNFGDNDGHLTAPLDYLIFIRGGTGVIFNNVLPDVISSAWGDKAELKFQIQNLRRNAGPYPCWAGGYPSPRQIGFGHVTGAAGSDGFTYLGDSDPVYIWSNTGTGSATPQLNDYGPDECGGGPAMTTFVQQNRDWFAGTKSGFTEYTYPHPLISGGTTATPGRPIMFFFFPLFLLLLLGSAAIRDVSKTLQVHPHKVLTRIVHR